MDNIGFAKLSFISPSFSYHILINLVLVNPQLYHLSFRYILVFLKIHILIFHPKHLINFLPYQCNYRSSRCHNFFYHSICKKVNILSIICFSSYFYFLVFGELTIIFISSFPVYFKYFSCYSSSFL